MKLSDLMLTDEQRRKIHSCRPTDKCLHMDGGYCQSQCNVKSERAAIANAVDKIAWAMLRPEFQQEWNALLLECRKVVGK